MLLPPRHMFHTSAELRVMMLLGIKTEQNKYRQQKHVKNNGKGP
jgi:hypothetical protein